MIFNVIHGLLRLEIDQQDVWELLSILPLAFSSLLQDQVVLLLEALESSLLWEAQLLLDQV
jgi:hypothetical protein